MEQFIYEAPVIEELTEAIPLVHGASVDPGADPE